MLRKPDAARQVIQAVRQATLTAGLIFVVVMNTTVVGL